MFLMNVTRSFILTHYKIDRIQPVRKRVQPCFVCLVVYEVAYGYTYAYTVNRPKYINNYICTKAQFGLRICLILGAGVL